MKNKKISLMIVGGISAVIFVVFSMFIYVNYVQDSLLCYDLFPVQLP